MRQARCATLDDTYNDLRNLGRIFDVQDAPMR